MRKGKMGKVTVAFGFALIVFTGCSYKAPSPVVCAPVDEWPQNFDLTGYYAVTMTATSGAQEGATSTGTMTLRAVDSPEGSMSGYRRMYIGSMDMDLAGVGALQMGRLDSDDPDMPGVVVQVRNPDGTVDILLRLGSEANRTDRTRFDGGYTVLRVKGLTENAFGGNWTSGVSRTDAQGTFCATTI